MWQMKLNLIYLKQSILLFVSKMPQTFALLFILFSFPAQSRNERVTSSTAGGPAPFQINRSNGETGPAADNLSPGCHTVSVTGAEGCMETLTVYDEYRFRNCRGNDAPKWITVSYSCHRTDKNQTEREGIFD